MKVKQTSGNETVRNDRILVTPKFTVEKDKEVALEDFSKNIIKELEDFFAYYNKMEGREFKFLGTLSAKDTWKMIQEQYTHHEA